jgi:putative PIN family toxin of toxin-antitoxin system
LKAVLDTNVLISAFVFPGGSPEAVYRLALGGDFDLVTSPPLLLEPGRVLQQKFEWEPSMAEAAVRQVARVSTIVEPSATVADVEDDPADNRVLEAAAEADAAAIVTGDRHLLELDTWRGIPILSPARFISARGKEPGQPPPG